MTSTTTVDKKTIQKLQRAIVDGLEDVKAQEIQVFDTSHLSPLFERVIVASGTSNRQTKALAVSVRDAVREAGFDKPRTEGESNGEWIIVDCGPAVVHIMQPAFRQYYKLEEIWGEKSVRLKLGAAKPVVAKAKASTDIPALKKAPASPSLRRSSAAKLGAKSMDAAAKKAPAKKAPAKKTSTTKPTVKKIVARKAAPKSSAKKPASS
jgi:ribosome-associated protein